jgi:hypothetical protein
MAFARGRFALVDRLLDAEGNDRLARSAQSR